MNRWARLILISSLIQITPAVADSTQSTVDTTAGAPQTFDPNKLWQACSKSTQWELCNDLSTAEKNTEKWGTNTLKDWGMLNTAVMMGIAYKVASSRQISYTDKTHLWFLPGDSRQIEVSQNRFIVLFSWPLPW